MRNEIIFMFHIKNLKSCSFLKTFKENKKVFEVNKKRKNKIAWLLENIERTVNAFKVLLQLANTFNGL